MMFDSFNYYWCGIFSCSHVKDCFKFTEDELDDLVLEDHVCRYVCWLHFRLEQRWAKDNGHILQTHPVLISMLNNSEKKSDIGSDSGRFPSRNWPHCIKSTVIIYATFFFFFTMSLTCNKQNQISERTLSLWKGW